MELQGKEGRKQGYLKPPILKGMATNSDFWTKYHRLVVSQGCLGTGWAHLLLHGCLTSGAAASRTLALKVMPVLLGPKQPL